MGSPACSRQASSQRETAIGVGMGDVKIYGQLAAVPIKMLCGGSRLCLTQGEQRWAKQL
jgi:hypothetical protein